MRLTRTTGYAVRILIDCAAAGDRLVKTSDMARRLEISPLNVFKIIHILSHAGFVEAFRGRNGGIRLARPAEDIRIGEVVRAIEATEMTVEERPAADGRPQLNALFDDAMEAFIGVLDQHSLADMAKGVPAKYRPRDDGRRRMTLPGG
jgi:Rrf2 family protein